MHLISHRCYNTADVMLQLATTLYTIYGKAIMEVVLFRSGIVVVINRALLCSYRPVGPAMML